MAKKIVPVNLTSLKEQLKKHVAAIHTSGDLSLLEHKALEQRRAEREAEFLRERTNEAVNALFQDDKRIWIQHYIDAVGAEKAKTYTAGTADFRDSLERLPFLAWLRKQLAPKLKPSEYKAWLKEKGIVDAG